MDERETADTSSSQPRCSSEDGEVLSRHFRTEPGITSTFPSIRETCSFVPSDGDGDRPRDGDDESGSESDSSGSDGGSCSETESVLASDGDEDDGSDSSDEAPSEGGGGGGDGDCSSSEDEETVRCPICLLKLKAQPIGNPEPCDHVFCLECILIWSRVGDVPSCTVLVSEALLCCVWLTS